MSEGSPILQSEAKADLTTEQVQQKIEDHIKDAELSSPRFKAFADYADLQFQLTMASYPDNKSAQDAVPLIEETVRQRKNEIPGYKREYGVAEKLHRELRSTIDFDKAGRIPDVAYLLRTKEQVIDARSQLTQQPLTPPAK